MERKQSCPSAEVGAHSRGLSLPLSGNVPLPAPTPRYLPGSGARHRRGVWERPWLSEPLELTMTEQPEPSRSLSCRW